jgi:hypothetical protein
MKKILWRAAVIVPVLAVLAAIPFSKDIFRSGVEATTLNPLVTAELDENRKAVEEVTVSLPVITEITAAPIVEELHYCIITGSFKLRQNAVNQAELLKKEGFEPEILDAPDNFHRVSAVRCKDINSALEKTASLSRKFPGSWVKKL